MNQFVLVHLRRQTLGDQTVRFFHKSLAATFQTHSEHLRDGGPDGLKSPMPQTVSNNVKNVVGWRGGAERGFLAAYPDFIHVIRTEGEKFLPPDLTSKYMKIFTVNLSSDILGHRYGILVPITYRQIQPKASKDEMQLTHILGWCVELVRAGAIVADRSSQRPSLAPKGPNEGGGDTTAPTKALSLDAGVFVVLKHYFKQEQNEKYLNFVDAVLEAQQFALMGRILHLNLSKLNGGGRLAGFDIQTYRQLIRNTISRTNFCLPASLALYSANHHDPHIHSLTHSILSEICYFLHVTRDYVDCYVDTNGSDIADGRISWLIILAKQRANAGQLAVLEQCYGRPDPECVSEVKRIYQDLNLKKICTTHINVTRDDINKQIQQMSKLDHYGLSQDFFFKLIENMSKS